MTRSSMSKRLSFLQTKCHSAVHYILFIIAIMLWFIGTLHLNGGLAVSTAHAAARSTVINFANMTAFPMIKDHENLDHGEWDVHPPDTIPPADSVRWKSESDGFATGTEGDATYRIVVVAQNKACPIQEPATVHIHWDNPYAGDNSYDASAPPGFVVEQTGGSDKDATVQFTLRRTCADVDSDGDGLSDEWETHGLTIDPNGDGRLQFIDLPAMGADVNKPDIFLHLDWMQDATHNQHVSSAAIKLVVDAFAKAPYLSPTGSMGINLHVDEGADSTLDFVNHTTWGALSKAQSMPYVDTLGSGEGDTYDWSAFQTIKDTNFTPTGRWPVFHYIIAAHYFDTQHHGGISRGIGASDFLMSLGDVSDLDLQAAVLMHELGHNLGLHHGGDDEENYKPNYISVMNYLFPRGLNSTSTGTHTFDYSRVALPSLDEAHLNERTGLGTATASFDTLYYCPGAKPDDPKSSPRRVIDPGSPIDWNCNGDSTETQLPADINANGKTTILHGYNDWVSIHLKGGAIGGLDRPAALPMITPIDELTPEQILRIVLAAPTDLTATAVSSSSIDLLWKDNATAEEGFHLEYHAQNVGEWQLLSDVPANTTHFTAIHLAANTTYTFRLRAFNMEGQSNYTDEVSTTTWPAVPVLNELRPLSTSVDSPMFTLTAIGQEFVAWSAIVWNGITLPTNFVNSNELTATISTAYLIRSSTAEVHVVTPPPGGGTSESRPFVIISTTPAVRLEFFRQPSDSIIDTPLTPTLLVRALDAAGNVATNFNGPVTVALRAGSGTAGAQLGGTTLVNAVNGVVTFSDLTIDRPGQHYILIARSANLGQPDSASFNVQAASSYVAMALRVPPDQNTASQFVATLTLQNHTDVDLPAGTRLRWLLQGLSFDTSDRNANTLTGATLTNLSIPQLSTRLDTALAPGATMTMTLHLTLKQPLDSAKLSVKAFMERKVGNQSRGFSSNMIGSTQANGATQPLRVTAFGGMLAGAQARFTFNSNVFANHEPVVITTTLPDSFQSLPLYASDTGEIKLTTYRGLAPGHYVVRVVGTWSGVTGEAKLNLEATNATMMSKPMSTTSQSQRTQDVEPAQYSIFLPLAQR